MFVFGCMSDAPEQQASKLYAKKLYNVTEKKRTIEKLCLQNFTFSFPTHRSNPPAISLCYYVLWILCGTLQLV